MKLTKGDQLNQTQLIEVKSAFLYAGLVGHLDDMWELDIRRVQG